MDQIEKKTGVILVAGGVGSRMGKQLPKQFLLLNGQPILAHTINRFAQALPYAQLVVVLPEAFICFWKDFAARFEVAKHTVVAGGTERFYSVKNGLTALADDTEIIAVQDGVRPLASAELIRRTWDCAVEHGSAIPVIEPVDSYRTLADGGSEVIDRQRLRIIQTPQIFCADTLRQAYKTEFDATFTDDASVVEHSGFSLSLCEGERTNFKITTPTDIICAEALLVAPSNSEDDGRANL
ncbi:MAG: 2-C-methyl-D-erythritol 4-phosphate cytidylyltransferase [Alistipes sp.]